MPVPCFSKHLRGECHGGASWLSFPFQMYQTTMYVPLLLCPFYSPEWEFMLYCSAFRMVCKHLKLWSSVWFSIPLSLSLSCVSSAAASLPEGNRTLRNENVGWSFLCHFPVYSNYRGLVFHVPDVNSSSLIRAVPTGNLKICM